MLTDVDPLKGTLYERNELPVPQVDNPLRNVLLQVHNSDFCVVRRHGLVSEERIVNSPSLLQRLLRVVQLITSLFAM